MIAQDPCRPWATPHHFSLHPCTPPLCDSSFVPASTQASQHAAQPNSLMKSWKKALPPSLNNECRPFPGSCTQPLSLSLSFAHQCLVSLPSSFPVSLTLPTFITPAPWLRQANTFIHRPYGSSKGWRNRGTDDETFDGILSANGRGLRCFGTYSTSLRKG